MATSTQALAKSHAIPQNHLRLTREPQESHRTYAESGFYAAREYDDEILLNLHVRYANRISSVPDRVMRAETLFFPFGL